MDLPSFVRLKNLQNITYPDVENVGISKVHISLEIIQFTSSEQTKYGRNISKSPIKPIKSCQPDSTFPSASFNVVSVGCTIDTVQDFLIKLGIKPRLNILEISIFSLNHVIVRPTKIMNDLLKICKICTFKVIFQHQKSTV